MQCKLIERLCPFGHTCIYVWKKWNVNKVWPASHSVNTFDTKNQNHEIVQV